MEGIKATIDTRLLPFLQASAPHIDSSEISECISVPNLFSTLRSEYMQTKYYKDHFDLVVRKLIKYADNNIS